MKSSTLARLGAAWFVVFALVMQMIAAGVHDGRARSLADLGAALGQPGFICLHQVDRSGSAPDHGDTGDHCWNCPLCQLSHQAGGILPVCAFIAIRTIIVFRWLFPAGDIVSSRRIPLRGLSRAPPYKA